MDVRIDIKSKEVQMIILAALLAVIALVLYFIFLLKPQVVRVADLVTKERKAKAELTSAEAAIANIARFRKEIESSRETVERYENILPVEQEIPKLLEELSTTARDSKVKIEGITPVVAVQDAGRGDRIFQEIPILISARSGYHELGRFLANLETAKRFMKVVDIEIRSNKSSPTKHSVELVVVTYVLLGAR